MSKFTPGPWVVINPAYMGGPFEIRDSANNTVCEVSNYEIARLIAAAPAMYNALANASHAAMFAYADTIEKHDAELADSLREWAGLEMARMMHDAPWSDDDA